MYMNTFAAWLDHQLTSRGWEQKELADRIAQAGYYVSRTHISRILAGERQAGGDAVVAIAHGLGVSMDEAMRARGWMRAGTDQSGIRRLAELYELLDNEDKGAVLKMVAALANQPQARQNGAEEELPSYLIEEIAQLVEEAEKAGGQLLKTVQAFLATYQRTHPRFYRQLEAAGILARAFPKLQNGWPSVDDLRPNHTPC
jgi:transcriptional regulator with XRE-family HTH domain